MRRAAFEPLHVEAFWFPNSAAFDAAKSPGQIKRFTQGRQPDGSYRNLKWQMHVPKARVRGLGVVRFDWA